MNKRRRWKAKRLRRVRFVLNRLSGLVLWNDGFIVADLE